MGANYAPLVVDLLFCYESKFMKNLSKSNDINLIEKFSTYFRYLDGLCSLDNIFILTINIFTLQNLFLLSQIIVMIKLHF